MRNWSLWIAWVSIHIECPRWAWLKQRRRFQVFEKCFVYVDGVVLKNEMLHGLAQIHHLSDEQFILLDFTSISRRLLWIRQTNVFWPTAFGVIYAASFIRSSFRVHFTAAHLLSVLRSPWNWVTRFILARNLRIGSNRHHNFFFLTKCILLTKLFALLIIDVLAVWSTRHLLTNDKQTQTNLQLKCPKLTIEKTTISMETEVNETSSAKQCRLTHMFRVFRYVGQEILLLLRQC